MGQLSFPHTHFQIIVLLSFLEFIVSICAIFVSSYFNKILISVIHSVRFLFCLMHIIILLNYSGIDYFVVVILIVQISFYLVFVRKTINYSLLYIIIHNDNKLKDITLIIRIKKLFQIFYN